MPRRLRFGFRGLGLKILSFIVKIVTIAVTVVIAITTIATVIVIEEVIVITVVIVIIVVLVLMVIIVIAGSPLSENLIPRSCLLGKLSEWAKALL